MLITFRFCSKGSVLGQVIPKNAERRSNHHPDEAYESDVKGSIVEDFIGNLTDRVLIHTVSDLFGNCKRKLSYYERVQSERLWRSCAWREVRESKKRPPERQRALVIFVYAILLRTFCQTLSRFS